MGLVLGSVLGLGLGLGLGSVLGLVEDVAHRQQRVCRAPLRLRQEERGLRWYGRERAVAHDVAMREEDDLRLDQAPRLAQHLVRRRGKAQG